MIRRGELWLVDLGTGLHRDSKAQAEQVRSVSVQGLGEGVGSLPEGLMVEVDDALRLHLQL